MKKWFPIFVFLASINLVSAATFSELLSSIDSSAVLYFTIFIVSFSILFFALTKFFKGDRLIPGIISTAIAFFIVYGINQSGLSVENFFFDLGISGDIMDTIYTIAPFLILAGIIFMIVSFKKDSLVIIGAFFIVISFFIEEKTIFMILGIILVAVRFFIPKGKWERKKKNFKNAGAGI
jgi:hypothetical protein